MSIKDQIFTYLAGFTYLLLGIFIIVCVLTGLFIFLMPDCNNKNALLRAKSLPIDNWSKIYSDAEAILNEPYQHYYELDTLPVSMKKIQPVNVVSHGKSLWLYLSACGFDDKVIVVVNTAEKHGQKIHIQWGDPVEFLDLWKKPNKAMKE